MTIAQISHWIQETGWATQIRESGLTYPIIMSLHLSSIAFFGGMVLVTNMRLLGLAMTEISIPDLVKQLRPWKWAGFAIIVTCGVLLAASKADTYYPNPYFRVKMALLFLAVLHALVFRKRVYGATAPPAPAKPRHAKLAACLSLALWLGILSMGRWIAYYEPPKAGQTSQLTER
jgi:uncharacterized membrane protein YfcA